MISTLCLLGVFQDHCKVEVHPLGPRLLGPGLRSIRGGFGPAEPSQVGINSTKVK